MSTQMAIGLGSIVFIVVWNGFFVAAEYAFVTVRRTRLQELVAQGSKRAASVLKIVDDPTHFISAMQLAITLSSLARTSNWVGAQFSCSSKRSRCRRSPSARSASRRSRS